MADATVAVPPAEEAHAPTMGVSNNKMAMWMLIGSECLFFGALISTYLIYVGRLNDGPGPAEIFDIPFTSVSTFILLMSSVAMVLALEGIQSGNQRRFRTWTVATALMGSVFLAGQIYEFTTFAREGMTLTTSPFSSAFFVLTGFHGIHVTVGVFMLLLLWVSSFLGRVPPENAETVEIVGLYWHFVDIVWIVIFTAIYLVPAALGAVETGVG